MRTYDEVDTDGRLDALERKVDALEEVNRRLAETMMEQGELRTRYLYQEINGVAAAAAFIASILVAAKAVTWLEWPSWTGALFVLPIYFGIYRLTVVRSEPIQEERIKFPDPRQRTW